MDRNTLVIVWDNHCELKNKGDNCHHPGSWSQRKWSSGNTTREHHRVMAGRASIPCSGSISPGTVNPIYQLSLKVKLTLADFFSKCKKQNCASSSDAWCISYYLYQMFKLAGLRVWGKQTWCDLLLLCNTVHLHGSLCWLPPFWQCLLTVLAKVYLPSVKPSHKVGKGLEELCVNNSPS